MHKLDDTASQQIIQLVDQEQFDQLVRHLAEHRLNGDSYITLASGEQLPVYGYVAKVNKMALLYKSLPHKEAKMVPFLYLPSILSGGKQHDFASIIETPVQYPGTSDDTSNNIYIECALATDRLISVTEMTALSFLTGGLTNTKGISPLLHFFMRTAHAPAKTNFTFLTKLIQSQLTIEAICKVDNGMSILHLMTRNLHRLPQLYLGLSLSDLIETVASNPEDYFAMFQAALNAKNDKGASPAYYIAMSNHKQHISRLLDLSMDIFTHDTINLVSHDGPFPGTTFAYFLSASYEDRHILERLLADRPHLLTPETLTIFPYKGHSHRGSWSMLYFVCMHNLSILPQLIMHHAKEITREVLNAPQADMQNSSALWYLAANHPTLISTLLNTNADIIDPNTFFKRALTRQKSAYDCLLDTPAGRGVLDTLRTKTSLLSTIEASIKLANESSGDSMPSAKTSITLLFSRQCDNVDAGPPTKAPKHEAGQSPDKRP